MSVPLTLPTGLVAAAPAAGAAGAFAAGGARRLQAASSRRAAHGSTLRSFICSLRRLRRLTNDFLRSKRLHPHRMKLAFPQGSKRGVDATVTLQRGQPSET